MRGRGPCDDRPFAKLLGGHKIMTSDADTGNDANAKRPAAADGAPRLAYNRTGRGEPLVLLHGQGFSRRCWDPVIDLLAADRDVIAVDLPGHGDSPRQPKGTGSAPHDLAVAVAELLDELDLSSVHVAGNSSGGGGAPGRGRRRRPRPVPAWAPAGLWRKSAPRHIRWAMREVRFAARMT